MARTCCASFAMIGGHSWSRSCHCAVDVVGVIGTFSLPAIQCITPRVASCTIICTVHQRHPDEFVLRWLVIEVTRSTQSLVCNQQASKVLHEFRESSQCSSCNFVVWTFSVISVVLLMTFFHKFHEPF